MNSARQGARKPLTLAVGFFVALALLAGCGKQEADPLEEYRASMENFYTQVSEIDRAIDAIDPESENAAQTLLNELDRLKIAFDEMAAVETPEEFAGMGDLPAEAAEYMDKAVTAYHDAYDGEFDEEAESLAGQFYERANVRIRYMLAILHGEADAVEEESEEGPEG